LPRRSIWVADLLTLEEIFEELYTHNLIKRQDYVRYVALRTALGKLAEQVLLGLVDQVDFEGDAADTAEADWPQGPDEAVED
jgi:hypothetical protein